MAGSYNRNMMKKYQIRIFNIYSLGLILVTTLREINSKFTN